MILEKTIRVSGRLAGVKEEIIANENQVGDFEFLKYDIFNASFIREEFFETALTNLNDNRLNQDEKVRNKLSHIMTHSFMDNLNFIVNNGEFLKMSTEDLYKYSLLTITSMKNAIRQLDKNVSI